MELIQEIIWPMLDENHYFHPKGVGVVGGLRRTPMKKHTNNTYSSINVQHQCCFSRTAISSPLFAGLDHLPGSLLPVSD